MKIRQTKRIITILLTVALTVLFGVSILNFIPQFNSKLTIQADPPAAKWYNLANIPLEEGGSPYNYSTAYDTYQNFTITNHQGLKVLEHMINWGVKDFENKYIRLEADIDCGGDNMSIGIRYNGSNRYFKGKEFDGNNHTISNFVMNDTTKGFHCKGNPDAYGFFTAIESHTTIKNLRLKDYSLTLTESTSNDGMTSGGIVGYLQGGTIQNCIVENFTVKAKYTPTYINSSIEDQSNRMAVAGVFAVGYGTVKNCLVKDVSSSSWSTNTNSYLSPGATTLVGIGPAGFPYYAKVRVLFSTVFNTYYDKTASTISGCVVQNVACTGNSPTLNSNWDFSRNDYATMNYPSSAGARDGVLFVSFTSYGHSISGCQSTQGNTVSGCSIEGGPLSGDLAGYPWYYGGENYNDGYPYLRQFIPSWESLNFSSSFGGDISKDGDNVTGGTYTTIKYPTGANLTISTASAAIRIMAHTIVATPDEGYEFKEWSQDADGITYTALFAQKTYNLTFTDATGVETGDVISPSLNATRFTVLHGSTMQVSHSTGTGPLTLTYKFYDVSLGETTVTYTIEAKYQLTNSDNPGAITSAVTITPTVAIKTFTITFNGVNGTDSNQTGDRKWENVKYGSSIDCNWANDTHLNFEKTGFTTVSYLADTDWRCKYVQITKDGRTSNLMSETSVDSELSNITSNITISPFFLKWFTITFAPAKDEYGNIDKATITSAQNTIEVESYGSITATLSNANKTLTYSYRGTSVVYQASQFYILSKDSNDLTNIQEDKTITPNAIFHACTVTMTNRSKDGNGAMANLSGYSAPFNVEFGTTLSVSESINSNITTYTYAFTYSRTVVKTVTYTTTNAKYEIDSYGINETATSYSFTNTNETAKTISPTFKVKQYQLTVKETKDGSTTTTNKTTYYGDIITYSADLSLNANSHFTYSSTSLYNSIATTELKYTGYFVESYVIKKGATNLTENEDGKIISNTDVVSTADIEITITFATFHTVTFKTGQTGVSSTTALNSYSNQINLRSGWKVTGAYSGYPSRELKYSISKADGSGVVEVFKYTLAQFYRVTNTNNVTSLQENTEIDPTIEFYACTVTMGSIGSDIGERNITLGSYTNDDYEELEDGKIEFIVEYKTSVEFKKENTATAGLFKYTYTFKDEAGNKLLTVTYTITNNQYAMKYDLDAEGNRIRMYNGINGAVDSDSATFEEGETSKPISPTFDKKQYLGEVA